MKQSSRESTRTALPVTRDLTPVYGLALVVAILMTGASVAGLLAPNALYPTAALRQSSVPNDAVNLLLGLPILLGAMALARRGKLLGLLFWPGALLYVLYNTLVYVFAMPLGWMTAIYAALALLSATTPVVLIMRMDREAVRQQFAGAVPARVPGGALVGFGALFLLRGAGLVANTLSGQATLLPTESALLAADVVFSVAWIVGGVLLWRRQALGYVLGAGLLFQAGALFVGLILVLLLQPLLTPAPFVLADVIVIAVMTLIYLVPFALFVRGAISTHSALKES
ncbi:MAG: hypothetical protein JXA21_09920 [Anaerolineae bacterium]|nr:hypothetical protein [Anaerolineae bacterium]